MPVWNTSTSSTAEEAAASEAASSAADPTGGGGGFDLERTIENVMDRAMSDPQFKAQIAQKLQESGIPPRLLFDELGGGETAAQVPQETPSMKDTQPDPDAQATAEDHTAETYQMTPQEVRSFLDEVIAFAGPETTLGDLRDLDDGMIQTALDMSDIPS